MVYKILSPLSHITVISAKVKFYRLSITLLPSVCLICLEIWNLKINRLILAPKNIYPFKECKPCAQDGEPCFGMWLFRKDLRFMGENQSYWGMSDWALSKALCCHNPYKFKWESQVGAGESMSLWAKSVHFWSLIHICPLIERSVKKLRRIQLRIT